MAVRDVPSSRWTGIPAALPAKSHSATSTAPMERTVAVRCMDQSAALRRSRSSGSRPISSGFRKRISPGPSFSAGWVAEPRKACPSKPASVPIRNSPSADAPQRTAAPAW